MSRKYRKRLCAAVCLVVLIPLLVPAALAIFFEGCATAVNWAFDGRPWTKVLFHITKRIEVAFGVDAETEYHQWQARMKTKRATNA